MSTMLFARVALIFLSGTAVIPSVAFGGSAMANLAKKYGLQTPALEILKSCDDIPRGTSDAVQSYEVAGEIICDETRIITINRGQDIEYWADDNIIFRNLHFAVHPNASLSLLAEGAVSVARGPLRRKKGSKQQEFQELPLFSVAGDIIFRAKGWLPRDKDSQEVDSYGVVDLIYEGRVHANKTPRYTKDSVVVSALNQEEEEEEWWKNRRTARKKSKYVPEKKTTDYLLKLLLVAISTWKEADEEYPLEPRIRSRPHPHPSSSGLTLQPSPDTVERSTNSHSNANAGDGDSKSLASTSAASLDVEETVTNSPDDTDYYSDEKKHEAHVSAGVHNPGTVGDHSGDNQRENFDSSGDHFNGTGHELEQSDFVENYTEGPRIDFDESGREQSDASGEDVEVESIAVLKVGDVLRTGGLLTSDVGDAAVWTGRLGTVLFGRSSETKLGEREEGYNGVRPTILIPSKGRKVGKVLRWWRKLRRTSSKKATAYEEDGSNEAHSEDKKGLRGWLAQRRKQRDERKRTRDERDAALMEQIDMTINRRGRVEVIVGGRNVLSRSGPRSIDFFNRFPFARRRKDSVEYEVYATDEGMEIRLEGRRVWGIRADDIHDDHC